MYATWKLNWEDPGHGTGPEYEVSLRGSTAWGIIAEPDFHNGSILGYIDAAIDLTGLEKWSVKYASNEEALAFAQNLVPDVTIDEAGNLVFPTPYLPIEG